MNQFKKTNINKKSVPKPDFNYKDEKHSKCRDCGAWYHGCIFVNRELQNVIKKMIKNGKNEKKNKNVSSSIVYDITTSKKKAENFHTVMNNEVKINSTNSVTIDSIKPGETVEINFGDNSGTYNETLTFTTGNLTKTPSPTGKPFMQFLTVKVYPSVQTHYLISEKSAATITADHSGDNDYLKLVSDGMKNATYWFNLSEKESFEEIKIETFIPEILIDSNITFDIATQEQNFLFDIDIIFNTNLAHSYVRKTGTLFGQININPHTIDTIKQTDSFPFKITGTYEIPLISGYPKINLSKGDVIKSITLKRKFEHRLLNFPYAAIEDSNSSKSVWLLMFLDNNPIRTIFGNDDQFMFFCDVSLEPKILKRLNRNDKVHVYNKINLDKFEIIFINSSNKQEILDINAHLGSSTTTSPNIIKVEQLFPNFFSDPTVNTVPIKYFYKINKNKKIYDANLTVTSVTLNNFIWFPSAAEKGIITFPINSFDVSSSPGSSLAICDIQKLHIPSKNKIGKNIKIEFFYDSNAGMPHNYFNNATLTGSVVFENHATNDFIDFSSKLPHP
eukprot:Pgem_evm1s290